MSRGCIRGLVFAGVAFTLVCLLSGTGRLRAQTKSVQPSLFQTSLIRPGVESVPAAPRPYIPTVAQTDAVCATCHAAIYARYLKTSMANASGNATEALTPGSFRHSPSGVTYTVAEDHGTAYMAYDRPASLKNPALHGRTPLDFYIGSNHYGRTYLFHSRDWWFEIPINYYSGHDGYDMAPNYLGATHMPLNLPVTPDCLHCHASALQSSEPGSRNEYPTLPFLQGGITCESCHGDAAAHVASAGEAAVVNPDKLTPQRRDAICYRCHLEGETNVQNSTRNPSQFRPGDRLEDFVTYFIREGNTATAARAVSQVEALNLSKCKRASGDRMTCTTCHDPHGDPAPAEKAAFYRASCLQCHTQEKFVSPSSPHAHHPEQTACIACHMPRISTEDIAHSQGTDHRIARRPGEYEAVSSARRLQMTTLGGMTSTPLVKLIPVPGTTASQRDAAVATFDLIATGDPNAASAAAPLLRAASQADPNDALLLTDLGWLAQHQGQRSQAAQLYAEALRQDPASIPANTNYGVLLAQAGQLQDAARLWERVYRQNPGITELGFNLGTIECALGNRPAAERILERLLTFQPDDPAAAKLLEEITSERKVCGVKK